MGGVILVSLALLAAAPPCAPGAAAQRALDALPAPAQAAPLREVVPPLRALREQFADDVFVHERYQDAVFAHGVEGELKAMLAEYARLRASHSGDPRFVYLAGRAALGRGTRRALAALQETLDLDPGFAPAHRTLAEIYGSGAFAAAEQERSGRERFLALCPGGSIARLPPALPPRSALFLRQPADAAPGEVERALQQDEARVLRMRLFDWYSPQEKQRALEDLQAEYWTGWAMTVRHYRRAGEPGKADALLAEMEDRLPHTRGGSFGAAARAVLELHAEARQAGRVVAALRRIRATSGSAHEKEIAELEGAFAAR
jgi:hypothetical protein